MQLPRVKRRNEAFRDHGACHSLRAIATTASPRRAALRADSRGAQ